VLISRDVPVHLVRDYRAFYEQYLGLKRSDAGPPHAVVFDTKPIAFAVRDVVAGAGLDAIAQPGQGMALWLHAADAQDIHDALAAADTAAADQSDRCPSQSSAACATSRQPWSIVSELACSHRPCTKTAGLPGCVISLSLPQRDRDARRAGTQFLVVLRSPQS
jgi:hypothetical protein